MPLFRASDEHGVATKVRPKRKRQRNQEWMESCWKTNEDGSVYPLTRLCLLSLADNMKELWAKDYTEKYLDHYSFREIMGPFNLLPGDLVEELTLLLCARNKLSRAALHLLLVPQLHALCLEKCPVLVTPALCAHIAARCQSLWSLDLSGAQQLHSKVLCETLQSLPALRSLCLAGTPCDRSVIKTITRCCCLLRQLNVSRCHLLSPSALLPLGVGTFCSSSDSPSCSSLPSTSTSHFSGSSSCSDLASSSSPTLSRLPLHSLLALDIGFGEQEGDSVAAAAYLLLSLPCLERVGMEGLAQACCLIENRDFDQANEFTNRERVPRLEEVWRERSLKQGSDSCTKTREAEDREEENEEEAERIYWEGSGSESEDDASRGNDPSSSQNQTKSVILRLRDVKGVTCDTLDSLARLCPGVSSLSVNMADTDGDTAERSQGPLLTAGLQTWSGQLRSLSILFPGRLADLLPALQAAGSSLLSLTLEAVKISNQTSLEEVIRACPKLKELIISAEPPPLYPTLEGFLVERGPDPDVPRLPDLCTFSLNFPFDHSQTKPVVFSMCLLKVLRCLLTGSPCLEKLSLISLPCSLDFVLQRVLWSNMGVRRFANLANPSHLALRRLQRVDLLHTDVKMNTLKRLMERSTRLHNVDVSYCWKITQLDWKNSNLSSKVNIIWK